MIRVHTAADGRLQRLKLFAHELVFDAFGWANADHLTAAELSRLREFHFIFDEQPDPVEEVEDLTQSTGSSTTQESGAPRKARAPKTVKGR